MILERIRRSKMWRMADRLSKASTFVLPTAEPVLPPQQGEVEVAIAQHVSTKRSNRRRRSSSNAPEDFVPEEIRGERGRL